MYFKFQFLQHNEFFNVLQNIFLNMQLVSLRKTPHIMMNKFTGHSIGF